MSIEPVHKPHPSRFWVYRRTRHICASVGGGFAVRVLGCAVEVDETVPNDEPSVSFPAAPNAANDINRTCHKVDSITYLGTKVGAQYGKIHYICTMFKPTRSERASCGRSQLKVYPLKIRRYIDRGLKDPEAHDLCKVSTSVKN